MRRFVITSPKFTGEAVLVYNEKETLCIVDASKTDMDQTVIGHFKHAAPVSVPELLAGKRFTSDVVIREEGVVVTFEQFYNDYPLKRNRYKVEQLWKKMNATDQVRAFYSLHGYKKYLHRNTWQTPMIADRYLRNREFETEWDKIK